MKRTLFLLASCFTSYIGIAAITIVTVTNFQFSPSNPTVVVGDTIRFDFVTGFHNAVSTGNTLPAGAAAINTGLPSGTARIFDYPVTADGAYSYYCEVHGGSGGVGMAANFTATLPLPLTMGAFSANIGADKSVKVFWKTYNESNVRDFTLMRSTDALHFTEIAKVSAKGNTEQEYSIIDNDKPDNRYIFYQLIITDLNGKKTYSNTATLKNVHDNGNLITKMGPSPLTRPEELMIQFNAENEGKMNVMVYNSAGKKVLTVKMQALPGLNNGHLHLCDLGAGVYNIKFAYENKVETKSIVVY